MCDCASQTQKAITEKFPNFDLNMTLPWKAGDVARIIILAERSQFAPKGTAHKPVKIIASFCPFCGEKYPEE